MACSARSTTNAAAQHNVEPSTASTNTTVGRRHEPQRDGFAAAVSPCPRRAEATGPPLRTQGSLSRSLARRASGPPLTPEPLRPLGLPPESWRLPLCGPRLDGRDLFVLDGWQQAGRTVSAP